jgi:hypothetical protein
MLVISNLLFLKQMEKEAPANRPGLPLWVVKAQHNPLFCNILAVTHFD